MRVIAGSARRIPLKTIQGFETRPTTDRIKETLFNMLAPYIADCKFLDLYSGSGAIGIEALSRGARSAVLVENNKQAIQCIQENLKTTKLEQKGVVCSQDVLDALKSLELEGKKFDIIFMDPPYHQSCEKRVLQSLQIERLMEKDSIIIVEASLNTNFDYIQDTNLQIVKVKTYKNNQHIFIQLK